MIADRGLRKKLSDYLYDKKKKLQYKVLYVLKSRVKQKKCRAFSLVDFSAKPPPPTGSIHLGDEYKHMNLYKVQRDQMEQNAFYRIRDSMSHVEEERNILNYDRIKEENKFIFDGENRNILLNYTWLKMHIRDA